MSAKRAGAWVGGSGPSSPGDKELLSNPRLAEQILASTPDVVYVLDLLEHRSVFASRGLATVLGYNAEEARGSGASLFDQLLHPDDAATVSAHRERLCSASPGEVLDVEYRLRHKRHGWRRLACRETLCATSSDGAPWQVLGVARDVTEQREATELLCDREQRYRDLIENLSTGVAIYRVVGDAEDFVMIDLNRAGERIEGEPKESLLGRSIAQTRPGIKALGLWEVMQRVWRTGEPAFLPVSLYQDKSATRYYENYVYKFGADQIVAVFSDETARVRAEELRQSQRDFALAVTATSDREAALALFLEVARRDLRAESGGILLLEDGRLRWALEHGSAVRAWEERTPLEAGNLLRQTMTCGAPSTYRVDLQWAVPTADRTPHPWSLVVVPICYEGAPLACLVLASSSRPPVPPQLLRHLEHLSLQMGHWLARLNAQIDKQRLEEQLRQAIKMEAVGRLAGGVAHDFNNIVTAIINYAEILLSDLEEGSALRSDLKEIYTAANRAADLTRQLLAFSRKQVIRPMVVDLNDVVARCQRMLARLIGEDVTLSFLPCVGPAQVRADPSQIEQILVNLVVNSRDAMPEGGELTISIQRRELDRALEGSLAEVGPGPWVVLQVQDNGHGMTQEILEHIFEPFFTTKSKDRGTGLGLATVYGIVKQNNGSILAESQQGSGTTFTLYLPQCEGEITPLEPSPPPPPVGEGTLLLVEDEPQLRTLASRILRRQGYTVLAAASGPEALRIADQYSGEIHLLVSDVVLPSMNGKELYQRLRSSERCSRVLFISGYSDDILGQHGLLDPGIHFLQKPFTSPELARRVRAALRG